MRDTAAFFKPSEWVLDCAAPHPWEQIGICLLESVGANCRRRSTLWGSLQKAKHHKRGSHRHLVLGHFGRPPLVLILPRPQSVLVHLGTCRCFFTNRAAAHQTWSAYLDLKRKRVTGHIECLHEHSNVNLCNLSLIGKFSVELQKFTVSVKTSQSQVCHRDMVGFKIKGSKKIEKLTGCGIFS